MSQQHSPRTVVPPEFLLSVENMSPAQRQFIESLLSRADLPDVFESQKLLDIFYDDKLSKNQASELIDTLKRLPRTTRRGAAAGRTADLPEVPPGRYAVYGTHGKVQFYRVRIGRGQFEGWTYLSIQASDEFHAITNIQKARKILDEIHRAPNKAAERYGRLLGRCFKCGRILTNPVSRHYGCGPICAKRTGWYSQNDISHLMDAGE